MKKLLILLFLIPCLALSQRINWESSLKDSYIGNIGQDFFQTYQVLFDQTDLQNKGIHLKETDPLWKGFKSRPLFAASFIGFHIAQFELIQSIKSRNIRELLWGALLIERFVIVNHSRKLGLGGFPIIWLDIKF